MEETQDDFLSPVDRPESESTDRGLWGGDSKLCFSYEGMVDSRMAWLDSTTASMKTCLSVLELDMAVADVSKRSKSSKTTSHTGKPSVES